MRSLLLILALLTPAWAADRRQILAEARRIMAEARTCTLITHAAGGRLSARTMDPQAPGADFVVWMATNPKSRKAAELRRDPRVTLYYFDEKSAATLSLQGRAALVDDPAAKTLHWKDEWKPFFPDRDASLLLLRVQPERLEVSSPSHGLGNDPVTWAAPWIDLGK